MQKATGIPLEKKLYKRLDVCIFTNKTRTGLLADGTSCQIKGELVELLIDSGKQLQTLMNLYHLWVFFFFFGGVGEGKECLTFDGIIMTMIMVDFSIKKLPEHLTVSKKKNTLYNQYFDLIRQFGVENYFFKRPVHCFCL